MKKNNIKMFVMILGVSFLPVSTVQAGELNPDFFRDVQQYNTVFCEDHNTEYLCDQYAAFDIDQDGKDEIVVYNQDPDGADGNFHWKIFRDNGSGQAEFVAEDDGSDVWNAGHSLCLTDGKCLSDHDEKGVVSYMYSVDTYVFYEDNKLVQLKHEQTQNYNDSNREFDSPVDVYTVNGSKVSQEEGERLLACVPEGEVVDLSTDNAYSIYADDTAGYDTDADYSSTGFIFPDSNTRYLDESDIAGMSAQELAYGRNEIYARYGRDFNAQELKDYFNAKAWYSVEYSADNFPYDILNEYEKANAKFLKKQEEALCPGGYITK